MAVKVIGEGSSGGSSGGGSSGGSTYTPPVRGVPTLLKTVNNVSYETAAVATLYTAPSSVNGTSVSTVVLTHIVARCTAAQSSGDGQLLGAGFTGPQYNDVLDYNTGQFVAGQAIVAHVPAYNLVPIAPGFNIYTVATNGPTPMTAPGLRLSIDLWGYYL